MEIFNFRKCFCVGSLIFLVLKFTELVDIKTILQVIVM